MHHVRGAGRQARRQQQGRLRAQGSTVRLGRGDDTTDPWARRLGLHHDPRVVSVAWLGFVKALPSGCTSSRIVIHGHQFFSVDRGPLRLSRANRDEYGEAQSASVPSMSCPAALTTHNTHARRTIRHPLHMPPSPCPVIMPTRCAPRPRPRRAPPAWPRPQPHSCRACALGTRCGEPACAA